MDCFFFNLSTREKNTNEKKEKKFRTKRLTTHRTTQRCHCTRFVCSIHSHNAQFDIGLLHMLFAYKGFFTNFIPKKKKKLQSYTQVKDHTKKARDILRLRSQNAYSIKYTCSNFVSISMLLIFVWNKTRSHWMFNQCIKKNTVQ